jgi:cell division protease FtsH
MEREQVFSIWYFIAAAAMMLVIQTLFDTQHTETLAYSEFRHLLRAGKLADIAVGERTISGTVNADGLSSVLPPTSADALTKGGGAVHRVVTIRLHDQQLVADREMLELAIKTIGGASG